MINKIKRCYCCEERAKEYKLFNGVYLCKDCNDFALELSNFYINFEEQKTETIKVSGSNGKQ